MPSYQSAKKLFELALFYTKEDNFKKYPNLKSKIEKTALAIILSIAKITALEPDEKTKKIIDEQIQAINKLSALFDISIDKNLVQKKDVLAIENQMQKLSEDLLNLKEMLNKK
ncbi:MAG: hypothetical protein U9N04_02660 [Patescibacteria group bacterium]|nr:hypothetical protein [Patescibacteria group bacterium]